MITYQQTMNVIIARLTSVFRFYYDGFRNMPAWGVRVWIIILVKLFIMFAILKLFFFPDFLASKYNTEKEKADYVLEQLLKNPDI